MAILSLPNELLLAILRHVEVCSVQDIKNCRLTCRRLRDVGSELLVRVIDVECSAASLSRLEAITSHPTIARGVHTVQIWLQQYIKPRYYQHLVAGPGYIDTASFIKWSRERIMGALRKHQNHSAARLVERIMNLWDVLFSAVRDDKEEDEEPEKRLHLKLIKQAQQQYMRLLANQAALLEGSDVRQQKNPLLQRLPTCDVGDLNTILYEDILMPGHGGQHVVSGWVVPRLLGDLVEARRRLDCHHQRCPLEALHISLDHVEDLFPTPPPAFADSIASELSQVKVFCAEFRYVKNPLNRRLKLAIASRHLERCTVACPNGDPFRVWSLRPYIGTALTCRNIPFTHLRQFQLTDVSFHQAELVTFLETCFVSPLCEDGRPENKGDYYTARVELTKVYLCSGTWQETLQALRRASQRTGPRAFFSVHRPEGAEIHEQHRICRIFGPWSDFSKPPWKFLNPDLALDMYRDYCIRQEVFRHFDNPWGPKPPAGMYDMLRHGEMELATFCRVPPGPLPAEHVGGDVDSWGWPNPCMMSPQEEEQEQQHKLNLMRNYGYRV
ncbi:hypothetical protein V8F06_004794 [Rhypophila decipiens]